MCGGGSAPPPQAKLPQAPRTPDAGSARSGGTDTRRRMQAGGTILTGGQGVTDGASTTTKTLLGQ